MYNVKFVGFFYMSFLAVISIIIIADRYKIQMHVNRYVHVLHIGFAAISHKNGISQKSEDS